MVINSFCPYFCSRKTKIPPKLGKLAIFNPKLSIGILHGKSRGLLIANALNLLSSSVKKYEAQKLKNKLLEDKKISELESKEIKAKRVYDKFPFKDLFCYYSAAPSKYKLLVINSFCHAFCSRKTKIPPKLYIISNIQPQAKAWGY